MQDTLASYSNPLRNYQEFSSLVKVVSYSFQLQMTSKGNTSPVAKESSKLHNKHSKSKSRRGHRKKNSKSELILSESNSPKKTQSNKNGDVNGTAGKGTESHRHYRNIANGVNQNNNHHTARNGCLLSNGYATGKSKEQSQPENQHIKVSFLQCKVKSVIFKVGVCATCRNHQTSLDRRKSVGFVPSLLYPVNRENGLQARIGATGLNCYW